MPNMDFRHLYLLGPTRVDHTQNPHVDVGESADHDVPRFRSQRTVALLGYLVAESRSVARGFLATLFWPDEEPSKGLANLSRELHNLAKILPDCLESDRRAVAFVPSASTLIDLYLILELMEQEQWEKAVNLLGGEFLEGIYLDDNLDFERWLFDERERWRVHAEKVLSYMVKEHMGRGRYSDSLIYARRLLRFSPWNEEAHRQVMKLLAWTGQRVAALRQFEMCKQRLWEELGVEPAEETLTLYQQINAHELDIPPKLPAFLTRQPPKRKPERPYFVARERELAQMDSFLDAALDGEGQMIFVTGGPGRGKTTQMEAFARRSMEAHPKLLVASGNCNAYSGVGDPFLPFRDVMAMLTGDVEARWDAGTIARDHAQRLWSALPLVVRTLLVHGPHLIDVLVPGASLLTRVKIADQVTPSYFSQLTKLVNRQEIGSQDVEQSHIFQQVTNVLRGVSMEKPLLLILDDFQWADAASIGLLFHLGQRLIKAASKVLIVCAYRPEEVTIGRSGQRHPLTKVLSELKRAHGDTRIVLGPDMGARNREFVDAILDAEPNRLVESFRSTLYQRTEGHPLFTVELLSTMKDRGELVKDENGFWIEGSTLNWGLLPARVEAVIEERIDRLNPELQETLAIVSVEGEVFTAQVVAKVQDKAEIAVLESLTRELERRHKLIKELEEKRTSRGTYTRYRFGHILFREYIYTRLGLGERRLLHGEVANTLEKLYEGHLDEIAVQLGYHFENAEQYSRALPYVTRAAERAARIHANDEAAAHYSKAIELAANVTTDTVSLTRLHRERGVVYETLGDFDNAIRDFEQALQLALPSGDSQDQWRIMIDLGKVWASRDYQRTRAYFEQALELARSIDDPAKVARSLNWMGNWYVNAEDSVKAVACHRKALTIFDELRDRQGLAITLDLLGTASQLAGNMSASVGYYDQAIVYFRALDDRLRLISSLIGKGTIASTMIMLATVPARSPPDAVRDIEEAIRLNEEIHSPQQEAWANWSLGLVRTVSGQFGGALEVLQNSLIVAIDLGHLEWEVSNRFALGTLYAEMFAPKRAQRELEQSLELCRGLQSQHWINSVSGTLAAAYNLLGDSENALACLQNVLSPQTSMDTMGKRYCWARRAELALFQGDPVLALKITEELTASALGLSPGGVITFLWQLKAEAFAALGRTDKAEHLLQVAISNARALEERFLLWRVHASLGRLYRATDRKKYAWREFSLAGELVQELADTIQDKALKSNFLECAHKTIEVR